MAQTSSISSALVKLHKLIMLDKKDVISVYFFAIIGGIISLSLPLGIQTIISFVMANTLSTSTIVLIVIVLFGVFLNGFVQVRQSQVIERIRQKIFSRYTLGYSYKIPKIKIKESQLELSQKPLEIDNKIKNHYNQYTQLQKQLSIANLAFTDYNSLLKNEILRFSNDESSLFLVNSRENKLLEMQQKIIEL